MGQETCAGCPQQRYATGASGTVQGPDPVGIVEGSCRYRARKVQVLDLVRVVGTVVPLGVGQTPRETWAQDMCTRCPQQRYTMGQAVKVLGPDRVRL